MSKELNSNKLNGKDLINAGIFSAIYVVIIMLVACTVGMIPIGFILLTFLVFCQNQKSRYDYDPSSSYRACYDYYRYGIRPSYMGNCYRDYC